MSTCFSWKSSGHFQVNGELDSWYYILLLYNYHIIHSQLYHSSCKYSTNILSPFLLLLPATEVSHEEKNQKTSSFSIWPHIECIYQHLDLAQQIQFKLRKLPSFSSYIATPIGQILDTAPDLWGSPPCPLLQPVLLTSKSPFSNLTVIKLLLFSNIPCTGHRLLNKSSNFNLTHKTLTQKWIQVLISALNLAYDRHSFSIWWLKV